MKHLTFGQYMTQLRKQKSMSQRKLAKVAGISHSTISRIEADLIKPNLETVIKLAIALEADKVVLLTKYDYDGIVFVTERCGLKNG